MSLSTWLKASCGLKINTQSWSQPTNHDLCSQALSHVSPLPRLLSAQNTRPCPFTRFPPELLSGSTIHSSGTPWLTPWAGLPCCVPHASLYLLDSLIHVGLLRAGAVSAHPLLYPALCWHKLYRLLCKWVNEQMSEWTNEWMNKWVNEQMSEWTDFSCPSPGLWWWRRAQQTIPLPPAISTSRNESPRGC